MSAPQLIGSVGNNDLKMRFDIEYGMPNNEMKRASKPVVIIRMLSSTPKIWKALCPCYMQNRMLIPCRHLLTTILYCIRESWISSDSSWMRALQVMKFLTNTASENHLMTNFVEGLIGKDGAIP